MSPRSFAILAGATAVALVLAVVAVTGRQTPTSAEPVSQALFPGLIDHVNEVRTVRIRSSQAILNVEAAGKGQWTLKERDGYPVEADKVRALVLAVANLQLVEAKTDKADRLK